MSKETHVFRYEEELDVYDEGRDINYILAYRFIPAKEATYETRAEDARIIPLHITYVHPDTGETIRLLPGEEDFVDVLQDMDEEDIMTETRAEIDNAWEARDENRPEDTPCLPRPWWENK